MTNVGLFMLAVDDSFLLFSEFNNQTHSLETR